ncbi:hypothetical protein HXX76_011660 [Chlamydomonas incerta]|uniref:RAP domain-containing protein n=1 Tax=Chlamydomonas incerta TaxID=51695 RepID=A0A835VPE9_CHLIN|nr:hypothetical protein HXX76_011660 [Chlamydomonas incerta]|eukprot:KAG2422845.1 hypothetical protein HXX76_011660 [Chlamydomonas incerta]
MHGLGKLRQGQQQRGSGWDPTSSPHLNTLADAVAARLRAAVGHGFVAQNISNSLWACAKLSYQDPALLLALTEAAAAIAETMTPQELGNSLWALEALNCTGPAYQPPIKALCGEALQRLQTPPELAAAFTPQELSNILLALEGLQLGEAQAKLVAAVAAEDVRRGFAGYVAQDISNSAWALAKMGFGVGPEAPAQQRQCGLEAALCGRLGELLQREPESMNEQNLANSLWAVAVFGEGPSSSGMQQLAIQLAREAVGRLGMLTDVELTQLWQAQQELGAEVAAVLCSSPDLQAATAAVVAEKREGETTDDRAVTSVNMGVVTDGVLAPLDVAVRLRDGRQVVVDFVGPTRFFSNRKHDPTAMDGRTILRTRQLRRALGESGVLLVPYWEWDGLQSAADQDAYLRRRLQEPPQPPQQLQPPAPPSPAPPQPPQQSACSSIAEQVSGGVAGNQQQQVLLARPPARRQKDGGNGRGAAGGGGPSRRLQ